MIYDLPAADPSSVKCAATHPGKISRLTSVATLTSGGTAEQKTSVCPNYSTWACLFNNHENTIGPGQQQREGATREAATAAPGILTN